MLRGIAVGALVLFLGAGLGKAIHGRMVADRVPAVEAAGSVPAEDQAEAEVESSTTTTGTLTPTTAELDTAVKELQSFVEQARGLAFKHPVDVALLDDAPFEEKVLSLAGVSSDELERTAKVLQALGLLEPGADFEQLVTETLAEGVAGLYDPQAKKMLVRGTKPTKAVRRTLVHELTHALDDQWFGLHRPGLADDDESRQAFMGVVEGDAERIEAEWMATLSYEERLQANSHPSGGESWLSSSIEPVLAQALAFQYVVGPPFVRDVLGAGGRELLDKTFSSPPRTSEQLMHPERFLAGDDPKRVAPPVPGRGPVVDRGVLGERGLLQVLQPLGHRATPAAEGWGGDRYVAWDEGSRTCLRANVVMDTPQEASELVSAMQALAAKRPGVTVQPGPAVTFTSCG
ncbi:MAG: hypothetical protein CYG61_07795 [Actinobacteria bacterium]|nr:MAG: hypothetical protein CYG61_07795 [Actinomycetota bacterium]